MTSECPVLDLLPILEGYGRPGIGKSMKSGLMLDTNNNVVATQENNRRIVEWSRRMCEYLDAHGIDGGSP